MVQTRECDFCGSEIEPGTGTMYVRTTGEVVHYCSSKCESNADLGREPRDVEWAGEVEEGDVAEVDTRAEEATRDELEEAQSVDESETAPEEGETEEAEAGADVESEAEAGDESEAEADEGDQPETEPDEGEGTEGDEAESGDEAGSDEDDEAEVEEATGG